MPDNWNNLADMFGTPSIDPPQRTEPPARKTPPPAAASKPKYASTVREDAAGVENPEPPKAKRKSTWDAVAEFFGVASPLEEESPQAELPQVERHESPTTRATSPQQVSDELFGRDASVTKRSSGDDLDSLLAGFRSPIPDGAEKVEAFQPEPRTREFDRSSRRDRSRSEASAGPRSRSATSTNMFAASEMGEISREVEPRGRRPERGRGDVRDQAAMSPDSRDQSDRDPERRGPRRRPRREQSMNSNSESQPPAARNSDANEHDDVAQSRDFDRDETARPRRTDRISPHDAERRPNRGSSGRRQPNEDKFASKPVQRPTVHKQSLWDEPIEEIDDERLEPISKSEFGNDSESRDDHREEVIEESRRPRRRRRRSRGPEAESDESDGIAETGRQIYGRHISEDDAESSRSLKVVPWVEAISVLVDKNIENHRHQPTYRSRGRQGGNSGRR